MAFFVPRSCHLVMVFFVPRSRRLVFVSVFFFVSIVFFQVHVSLVSRFAHRSRSVATLAQNVPKTVQPKMDTKVARNRHGSGTQPKNRPNVRRRLACGRAFIFLDNAAGATHFGIRWRAIGTRAEVRSHGCIAGQESSQRH